MDGASLCSATSEASFLGIYWMNFTIFFTAVSLGAMSRIMALLGTCRNSVHARSVLHQCCTHWEKQILKLRIIFYKLISKRKRKSTFLTM